MGAGRFMSRGTSKKTGKNSSKGSQNKAINKPAIQQSQKANATNTTAKPQEHSTAPALPDNNKQVESSDQVLVKNEAKHKNSTIVDTPPLTNSKELSVNKESSANKESSDNKEPQANNETSSEKSSSNKKIRSTGTEAVQTTTKKKGSGLSFFAILLSLIALGFSGYQWYSSQISTTNTNAQFALDIGQIGGQVTRISDSVTRLKADQSDIVTQAQLDNKIIKSNSSFEKQVRKLEQAQSNTAASVTTINEELRKGANQYVLDEVSQLLRLANNSAIFTGDATSAVNAFTLADIQLKELNNPRYSVVRRKINEEIELLKSIKQIDSEKILAQLNSISSKITSLPLENEFTDNVAVKNTTETTQKEIKTWRTELNQIWSDLVNSVSIQRVDQPPKALLAPSERYLLDQNLQLQLVKAEIALLKNNQTLYVNSITEASKWVSDYFDPEDDVVKDTLAQLTLLKNEKLNIKLPAVSGSYDLLQTIKGGQ